MFIRLPTEYNFRVLNYARMIDWSSGYWLFFLKKSLDGVLGIRTRGRRMVGADDTT